MALRNKLSLFMFDLSLIAFLCFSVEQRSWVLSAPAATLANIAPNCIRSGSHDDKCVQLQVLWSRRLAWQNDAQQCFQTDYAIQFRQDMWHVNVNVTVLQHVGAQSRTRPFESANLLCEPLWNLCGSLSRTKDRTNQIFMFSKYTLYTLFPLSS